MPEVIQVRPKGIYVNIEFPLDELKKLRDACNHIELKIDMKKPEEVAVGDYFTGTFYPFIRKIVEDLVDGSR